MAKRKKMTSKEKIVFQNNVGRLKSMDLDTERIAQKLGVKPKQVEDAYHESRAHARAVIQGKVTR